MTNGREEENARPRAPWVANNESLPQSTPGVALGGLGLLVVRLADRLDERRGKRDEGSRQRERDCVYSSKYSARETRRGTERGNRTAEEQRKMLARLLACSHVGVGAGAAAPGWWSQASVTMYTDVLPGVERLKQGSRGRNATRTLPPMTARSSIVIWQGGWPADCCLQQWVRFASF